jgi:hypothetical protein
VWNGGDGEKENGGRVGGWHGVGREGGRATKRKDVRGEWKIMGPKEGSGGRTER